MRGKQETTEVELTLAMRRDKFAKKQRRHLENVIAAFLGVFPTEVKTTSVRRGSAVVVLQVPIAGAAKLEHAFRNHDPELFAHLSPLIVTAVHGGTQPTGHKKVHTGKELEREVADLYRQSGAWKVQHDVDILGNQIDVYVELTALGSRHRLAVEVKDTAQQVGKAIVNDLAKIVFLLRAKGVIDEGVIVSAAGFTRPARTAAREHGITLLETSDLVARLEAERQSISRPAKVLLQRFFDAVHNGRLDGALSVFNTISRGPLSENLPYNEALKLLQTVDHQGKENRNET